MKNCFRGTILLVTILSIMSGCHDNTNENDYHVDGEKVVKETMNPSVYLDPAVDLISDKTISVIIEFKTKPAVVAVLEAKEKGIPLTLEEAKQKVEESHETFQKELQTLLDENQVTYKVMHNYKTAFNGVSMELPANEIKRLLDSSVISKIYPNREIQLDPPITPYNQM
jgi:hypothetical protein